MDVREATRLCPVPVRDWGKDAVDILLDGIVCAEFLVDIFFRRRGGLARIMPDMSGTAYGFRMGMEGFITSIAF